MSLIFRVENRPKIPRITVLRKKKKGDKRDIPERLGSFNIKKPFDHITDQLTEEELYEFQNFVRTIEFAKAYFECQVNELDRFILKAPLELKEALYDIWQESSNYGIEFLPEHEMLLAVLNRAKQVEQQLKTVTNGKFSALSKIDIDINKPYLHPEHSIYNDQKVFSALFNTGLSYEAIADKFNDITESFNKRPKFTAKHFEIVREKLLIEGKETFPKWHYTIAIEALKDLGVDLKNVSAPATIALHWLRLNKQSDLNATLISFNADIDGLSENMICHNIIKKSFIDDELIEMGHLSKNQVPLVSIAVDKWVRHWKKSNKANNTDQAMNAFKKQFPISAQNQYIQALLASYFD